MTDGGGVDLILPGLIEAHPGYCFGRPRIPGSRLPVDELWLAERIYVDHEDYPGPTPEQRLAGYAFALGVEWQRDRKRRRQMKEAVARWWAERNRRLAEEATVLHEMAAQGMGCP